MTIQKNRSGTKQRRLQKRHQEMTEKEVLRAALYVTVTDEQLERAKVKGSWKQKEMTPQEIKDYSARCQKRAAEAVEKERARQLDYVGERIKASREARAEAIARNQIIEGDEVQLKQKITAYRGQDVVPLPDWMLAEGLYGRVEQLIPGEELRPGWWKKPGSAKRQPVPPHAMIVYPDLYVGFNVQSSRVEFKYIGDYDCVNKAGEVVPCETFEECENPEFIGFTRDKKSVLIDGVVHTVLHDEDCEIPIPTHWLEQSPGNQRHDF